MHLINFKDFTGQQLAEMIDKGIEIKHNLEMFRKTLVSWLIACYPEKQIYIQSSMGHDGETIVNNYLGLGFTREQTDHMRLKYLYDWGVVV